MCWQDNIKERTELPLAKTLALAEDKDGWRKIIKSSVVPLQPPKADTDICPYKLTKSRA